MTYVKLLREVHKLVVFFLLHISFSEYSRVLSWQNKHTFNLFSLQSFLCNFVSLSHFSFSECPLNFWISLKILCFFHVSLPAVGESLVSIRFDSLLVWTTVIEVNCFPSLVWPLCQDSFYSVMFTYIKAVLIKDSFHHVNVITYKFLIFHRIDLTVVGVKH